MRLCIQLLTVWLTLLATANANRGYKRFCYYTDWSYSRSGVGEFEISNINPYLCTHLVYAFGGITPDGNITALDQSYDLGDGNSTGGFERFNALKKQNKKLKTLISIGGWTQSSTNFTIVVNDADLRAAFVENAVNFLVRYGFDGLDCDWEYPNQRGGNASDVQNFVHLLEELRVAFDCHGFILTAAVGAGASTVATSYNVSGILAAVDYINLMTYDFHGSWDTTTGHNTPLYPAKRETTASEQTLNINASVRNWISLGAPASKILLGTAAYGKSFTLTNSSLHVPGSPISGVGTAGEYSEEGGVLLYYEICPLNWTVVFDNEQRVPYAYSGNQWVSFDNVKSITEKAKFVRSLGLAGSAMWAIDQDDFRGLCGVKNPLLSTLYYALPSKDSHHGTSIVSPEFLLP